MTKYIEIAKGFYFFRIIPRILILSSYIFGFYYIYWITGMYFALEDKSPEITAFMAITIPAITGIISSLTVQYFKTGKKWDVD